MTFWPRPEHTQNLSPASFRTDKVSATIGTKKKKPTVLRERLAFFLLRECQIFWRSRFVVRRLCMVNQSGPQLVEDCTGSGELAGAGFAGHCLSMGQGIVVGIRNSNPVIFSAGMAT